MISFVLKKFTEPLIWKPASEPHICCILMTLSLRSFQAKFGKELSSLKISRMNSRVRKTKLYSCSNSKRDQCEFPIFLSAKSIYLSSIPKSVIRLQYKTVNFQDEQLDYGLCHLLFSKPSYLSVQTWFSIQYAN